MSPPFAFAPNWGEVTPFVLRRSSQFRPQRPYHVGSKKYAADYNEIKLLGGDNITTPSTRTADQTEIGLFWIESSPLAWNRLARALSVSKAFDLWENARLFGLLNLAMADGYIAIVGGQVSLQLLAANHRDSAGRHGRQSRYGRSVGLDATAIHISDAGSRLRARGARRGGGGDPEAGLRHRRHPVHGVQYNGRPRTHVRRPSSRCSVHTRASRRQQTRTPCRGSTSAFTSDVRSRKASNTAGRSPRTPFSTSSSRCSERAVTCSWRPPGHRPFSTELVGRHSCCSSRAVGSVFSAPAVVHQLMYREQQALCLRSTLTGTTVSRSRTAAVARSAGRPPAGGSLQ